jgi:tungstate transport system permease protein
VSCSSSCVAVLAQSGVPDFVHGLGQGVDLVTSGNRVVLHTTLRTLRLAIESTAFAAAFGVPCGCALGLGRSRATRALRTLANGLARFPPVGIGVIVILLLTDTSPWGGGPLASLHWASTSASEYLAQTLLAVPIVIVLTSSAVQGVSPGLLEQARAYGAPRYGRAVLALREARRAVVAAVIVALGITITAIGALIVASSGVVAPHTNAEPATLALGAYMGIRELAPGNAPSSMDPTQYHSAGLAVAYSIILIGLFVVIAAALTLLQERQTPWVAGRTA